MASPMGESYTQFLANFLEAVGDAVANLNTVVVGLDAVEHDYQKPESLDISWSPANRVIASRKARKFVVEATLIRVHEALYDHMSAFLRLPVCREVSQNWTNDTIRADKIWDTYRGFVSETSLYHVAAATLMTHWRNRIVHSRSNATLKANHKRILQASDEVIAQKYKGLSVDRLLCHFEEGRPTLKDVSSMIAMAINLVREVDSALPETLDKDGLDALLSYYNLNAKITKVTAETKSSKREASIRKVINTYAPRLLPAYEEYYLPLASN